MRESSKGLKETLGEMGRFTVLMMVMASEIYACIKLIKIYAVNICSLLYVNYTLIKII